MMGGGGIPTTHFHEDTEIYWIQVIIITMLDNKTFKKSTSYILHKFSCLYFEFWNKYVNCKIQAVYLLAVLVFSILTIFELEKKRKIEVKRWAIIIISSLKCRTSTDYNLMWTSYYNLREKNNFLMVRKLKFKKAYQEGQKLKKGQFCLSYQWCFLLCLESYFVKIEIG